MADGSGGVLVQGRIVTGQEASTMQLRDALAAGHVVARCRCGHAESVDTHWWQNSRVDLEAQLGTLSRRVRCICGARDVELEVWPLEPVVTRHRTYLWRA